MPMDNNYLKTKPPASGAPTVLTPPPVPSQPPVDSGIHYPTVPLPESASKLAVSPSSGGALHELSAGWMLDDLSNDVLLALVPRTQINGRPHPLLDGVLLSRKLGQGGMGAVYMGFHRRLGKKVAVKVLPLQGAMQPQTVQRFYREAQLAAQVQSPHLVGVLDVNEQNGLSYIVMELVEGPSAQEVLMRARSEGQRGLPEALALDICIAASRGISAAHTAGIIHRDIKPDNILLPGNLEKQGAFDALSAKLADLGLARQEHAEPALTGTHGGMGTPGYMAPEQALNAGTAGKAADVFGLGATLYALLCGHAPFHDAEAMQIIVATLQQPHVQAQNLRRDVSFASNALLERCLHKDPQYRFTDGTALLNALIDCRNVYQNPPEKQKSTVKRWNDLLTALPPSAGGPGTDLASRPSRQSDTGKLTLVDTAVNVLRRGADRVSYWRAMSRGRGQLKRMRWTQAEDSFRLALRCVPDDKRAQEGVDEALSGASETRFKIALAEAEKLANTENWDAAKEAYQRALSERPQHPGAMDGRGRALYQQAMRQARTELDAVKPDARGYYTDLDVARRNRVECALTEALNALPNDRAAMELVERVGDPREVYLDLGEGVNIALVRVREGEFDMGSQEGGQHERPARRVKIGRTYYLAKSPITVKQFSRFVQKTSYISAAERAGKGLGISGADWGLLPGVSWKQPGYSQTDDHPAVLLSWFDAQVFCTWLARNAAVSWTSRQKHFIPTLPSEAQWEYATRGPQSLRYAWGQIWDGQKANHADASLSSRGTLLMCSNDNDGFPFASPVGRFDNASWCGAQDLIGNVWEWCHDWYADDYYQIAGNADPRGPEKGTKRIIRGGSWADMPMKCRAYTRRGAPPEGAATNVGFRIAVSFQM